MDNNQMMDGQNTIRNVSYGQAAPQVSTGVNAEQAKKVIGLKVEGIVDGVKTTQFYDVDVNIA